MAMLSHDTPLNQELISELQKCNTEEERAAVRLRYWRSIRASVQEWAKAARMLDLNNDATLAFRADAPRSTRDPSMLATSERRR